MIVQRIALVEFDDSGTAQLIRLHLEHLGLDVALNRLGKPSDFFGGFQFFGHPADAAIIAAHGDDGGFIFPEMAEGVDDLVLPENRITPELVTNLLTAPPPLVISTACSTGTKAFADAFRAAGAATYIAPTGDPEGRDVPLWMATFFHALTRNPADLSAAITNANAPVDPESRFEALDQSKN